MREVKHSLEIGLNHVRKEVIEGDGETIRLEGFVRIKDPYG